MKMPRAKMWHVFSDRDGRMANNAVAKCRTLTEAKAVATETGSRFISGLGATYHLTGQGAAESWRRY
jgi:hypothetical protein